MKLLNTLYYKGREGYQAETLTETDGNGKIWEITTLKGRQRVYCYAKQGQDNGNGSITYNLSNMMAGDNETYFNCLAAEEGQCNEAKVKRVHEAGLKAFLQRVATLPEAVKPYTIEVGQIIFDESRRTTRVIYATTEKAGHYKAVDLEGTKIENVDFLQKGDYKEGNLMDIEQVNELVNRAHEATRERKERAEHAATLAAIDRAKKIEEGKKIISEIPEGVQAIIVAELHENTSDSQSDYHGHTTKEVVYLAWSTHKKDIFSEMRKAADKFTETKHLGTGKSCFEVYQVNENGRYIDHAENQSTEAAAIELINAKNAEPQPNGYTWEYKEKEIEHREKYSMGSGYYLKDGHSDSSGWSISKDNLGQYGPTLEALQIAAAEGRYFCNLASPDFYNAGNGKPEATAPQHEAQEVTAGTVQIVDYSEKAIAVIGDTKTIKDKLKSLGGKFNFRLSCGPGWIFKKSDLEKITKALTPEKVGDTPKRLETECKLIAEPTPEPETIEEAPITAAEYKAAEAHAENEAARESETINSLAIAANYEQQDTTHENREPKKQFCRPTTAPAFLITNVTPEEANDRAFMESLPEGTGDGHGYTHKPAFFRESGPMTRTQREQQEAREAQRTVSAAEYKPNPDQARGQAMGRTAEGQAIQLYSETRQGANTGRAQQGFLF